MTDLLFDAPYNKEASDFATLRLRHFYFVIPSFNSDEATVAEELEKYEALQKSLPQWAVQHIITRDALYGPNLPVFTEEYVVAYASLDNDGNRVFVTTPYSTFKYSDITYQMVSP